MSNEAAAPSGVEGGRSQGVIGTIPKWIRVAMPVAPAGLTFGPLLMVIPSASLFAYAGALLLGLCLAMMFIVMARMLEYSERGRSTPDRGL
ncbi:MAG: hypothetical protein ACTS3F_07265 [Phycisphaerales bacterium]